ncbi:MAG: AAA family ATPase [Candidatus Competibacteraceae bacterium]|nr:AAA family ATPase [Candidatus Competibacteraceae bacterium]
MSIILIGGEKGGTGKTTLAVNLAALRALQGRDVLLIDTDIQASASYWAQTRDEAGIQPRVACIQKFGKGLQTEVRDLAKRYQDIVIDAGAGFGGIAGGAGDRRAGVHPHPALAVRYLDAGADG